MTEAAPVATTHPWLYPLLPTTPPSLSERLIRALEAHAAAEAHDIAACEQLAQRAGDPIVGFLFSMIVQDQHQHHALLRSMIARLQEEVEFVASPSDSLIPRDSMRRAIPDAADIAGMVRAVLRDEHEAARHVRHLARQEPGVYDGLYPLLLETLARDCEKHAAMLHFILRRLEQPPR